MYRYGVYLCFILTQVTVHSQSKIISLDVRDTTGGAMTPFWSYFGYDEPNYTYTHDGKKLLTQLQTLSYVPVHVRTHNLLTSRGNSSGPDLKWGYTDAYMEKTDGSAIYNWVTVDSIIDTYILSGMKPLMEIGFMPKDLSSHPEPYDHTWSKGGNLWTGWTYPPKDYKKWGNLVNVWVRHSIDRYGEQEVKTWLWEVWNEPDIPYWSGTLVEYLKLYDYAADGLKRACPECRIGGPHTTSPRNPKAYNFLIQFIDHCLHGMNHATGRIGTPLDYVGFHAKGAPEMIDGHIQMNMGAQLKDVAKGFEAVNAFPEIKNIPVIIGECDPEGCAACSEKRDPKYGYRNGTMYSSYTAASYARIYELMDQYHINLQGAVSWSFEFENQEWFAGFRDLATHGVDKPVLNVFRILGKMKGQRIPVQADNAFNAGHIMSNGVRLAPDIHAISSTYHDTINIMVWNYHDDDVVKTPASVLISLNGLNKNKYSYASYRIDQTNNNSFEQWKSMGRPQAVNQKQYAALEKAGTLKISGKPIKIKVKHGKIEQHIDMPGQGVCLMQFY